MKQRIILLLALLLSLPVTDGAWAQTTAGNKRAPKAPVEYIVRSFTDGQLVSTPTQCDDYTVIEGSHQGEWIGLGSADDSDDHYYVVRGNVEYKTLNVFGQTHLILEDGASLTCTGGIKVERVNNHATLYIYSQSDGDNAAGIGGSQTGDCGSICIHGGDITTTGGQYGAGIGGGGSDGEVCPSSKAGVVTIMGGSPVYREINWKPDTGGEIITGIKFYTQGWYGTHGFNYNTYDFPIATNRMQIMIFTYDEASGEGKIYLRPFNVSTGLFTFKDNGVYGGFGRITAVATTFK